MQSRNKRFAVMVSLIQANNAIAAGKKIAPTPVVSQWLSIRGSARNRVLWRRALPAAHRRVHAARLAVPSNQKISVATIMDVAIQVSAMDWHHNVRRPLISRTKPFATKSSFAIWASVPVRFVLPMAWNRVNAFRPLRICRRKHANCVAKYRAKMVNAKARSSGTMCRTMFQICSPNRERHVTITMGMIFFFK